MSAGLMPDTRCLGLLPAFEGTQRCAKRDTCARFVNRHDGNKVAQWLCPTRDDYYGAYIKQEETE